MEFQQTHPKSKITPCKLPERLRETIFADMLILINSHFLCVVKYHSKYSIVSEAERMSPEHPCFKTNTSMKLSLLQIVQYQ